MSIYRDLSARLETLFFIIKSTKNWPEILGARFFSADCPMVYFRNGHKLPYEWKSYIFHAHLFSRLPSAKLTETSLTFDYLGQKLTMEFGKYGFGTIYEIFAFDPYKDFMKK